MSAYRDTVDIKSMDAADGVAVPTFGSTFMASVPCRIVTTGGYETYKGRVLEAGLTHLVEMQWLDSLSPQMQLNVVGGIHTGRVLNIRYIRPVEGGGRARKAELLCASVEAA